MYWNVLWHFDSAHKLIRWKLIVHVCFDGFSCLITHCRCCDNNRARLYGDFLRRAPKPIICQQGQDVIIEWRMFLLLSSCWREEGIITESSVHNCWVERECLCRHSVFLCKVIWWNKKKMALFCLHYIFLPKISKCLGEIVDQMNQRPVSTEHNKSPLQLWTSGLLQNINSQHTALTVDEMEQYGTMTVSMVWTLINQPQWVMKVTRYNLLLHQP